jgi:hypothetical protein
MELVFGRKKTAGFKPTFFVVAAFSMSAAPSSARSSIEAGVLE